MFTYILYALPAYIMSGLPPKNELYWPFIISFATIVILNSLLWRYASWMFAYAFGSRTTAAFAVVRLIVVIVSYRNY